MQILLRLVKYATEPRPLFIGAVVVMVALVVPRVAVPRLVGEAIDDALTGTQTELALTVGMIVLAGILDAVLFYMAMYLAEKVGRTTEYRLRNSFFDKLQSLNFGFYDRQKTGDLMSRATGDADSVAGFISNGVLHGISVLAFYPGFPILGVFRLNGQPKRDDGMIFGSCKASQSPVYPTRDAFAVVEHPSCPSSSSSCPLPVG